MWKAKELAGKRFGMVTVIERVGKDERGNILWKCKCDCGKEFISISGRLNSKRKSCGCNIENSRLKAVTTHGMHKTKIYSVWASMKSRCYYKGNKSYKNYGGRGIKVCPEWKDSFETFYEWAIKSGYEEREGKDKLTLERIDFDKDYCPDNCRWASYTEQARNRRNNTVVSLHGESHTLIEWAEITGQKYTTVTCRIQRGWSAEEAVIGHRNRGAS